MFYLHQQDVAQTRRKLLLKLCVESASRVSPSVLYPQHSVTTLVEIPTLKVVAEKKLIGIFTRWLSYKTFRFHQLDSFLTQRRLTNSFPSRNWHALCNGPAIRLCKCHPIVIHDNHRRGETSNVPHSICSDTNVIKHSAEQDRLLNFLCRRCAPPHHQCLQAQTGIRI